VDGIRQDVPGVGGPPFCASRSGMGSVVSAIMRIGSGDLEEIGEDMGQGGQLEVCPSDDQI